MHHAVIISGEWQRDSLSLYRCPFSPQLPSRLPPHTEQSSLGSTVGPCWSSIVKIAGCAYRHRETLSACYPVEAVTLNRLHAV